MAEKEYLVRSLFGKNAWRAFFDAIALDGLDPVAEEARRPGIIFIEIPCQIFMQPARHLAPRCPVLYTRQDRCWASLHLSITPVGTLGYLYVFY